MLSAKLEPQTHFIPELSLWNRDLVINALTWCYLWWNVDRPSSLGRGNSQSSEEGKPAETVENLGTLVPIGSSRVQALCCMKCLWGAVSSILCFPLSACTAFKNLNLKIIPFKIEFRNLFTKTATQSRDWWKAQRPMFRLQNLIPVLYFCFFVFYNLCFCFLSFLVAPSPPPPPFKTKLYLRLLK